MFLNITKKKGKRNTHTRIKKNMQSPCIRKIQRACFHGCCPTPILRLAEPQNNPEHGTTTTTAATTTRYDFIAATALSLYPNTQLTNHESLPSLAWSLSNMKKAYPQYSNTDRADQMREQEYYNLSIKKQVCLDYIGHCLFSYSQQLYSNAPFFNIAHKSANLYTQIMHGGQESEFESLAKERIMRFMNISPDDYSLFFTANQASAFKLLADSFPFHTNRNLLTVYDHESDAVEAMIESSTKRGAKIDTAEFSWPNMRLQSRKLRNLVVSKRKKQKKGLFVFPLQSKVTGVRYSYLWMSLAQENGWHVCLDATALGAKDMETLGLSLFQPDFITCSFYKVFGENPSGFGCLFVKKSRASIINNSSTSTGMVSLVLASNRPQFLAQTTIPESEEHETTWTASKIEDIDMASISSSDSMSIQHRREEISEIQEVVEADSKRELSLAQMMKLEKSLRMSESNKNEASSSGNTDYEFRGLDHADSLGLVMISSRTRYLVNWLVNALCNLKHPHSEIGVPLVRIYGTKVRLDRAPIIAFNVFDWKGEKVDPALVQKLADRNNISLSYAILKHICFLDKNIEERERSVETRNNVEQDGKKREKQDFGIAVITASLGFLTNFEDTYRVWAFVSRFLDADFVEKERWRYMALNRTTVEV